MESRIAFALDISIFSVGVGSINGQFLAARISIYCQFLWPIYLDADLAVVPMSGLCQLLLAAVCFYLPSMEELRQQLDLVPNAPPRRKHHFATTLAKAFLKIPGC